MDDLRRMLVHGAILSVIATLVLLGCLRYDARMLVQDYPPEIQRAVPPRSVAERRRAFAIGIPFLLLLVLVPAWSTWTMPASAGHPPIFAARFTNAFVVASTFNLVDLLVLDWLVFCTLTPRFVVLPGSEGMPAYKDFGFHVRGFLIGTALSAALAAAIAGVVHLAR